MRACNCARASPFQSRTCVGCDLVILYQRDVLPVVSIHAPAWGATPLPRPSACRAKSFKPRTRVGCDTAKPPDGAVTVGFNPRTRVGCDQSRLRSLLRKSCFNPRTRVGCDQFIRQPRRAIAKFQSTHPRGVRHRHNAGQPHAGRFQSTHPRGVRRDGFAQPGLEGLVSIHAPAWGATCR